MEAAGLAIGILGITSLFSACVENFDIVVRAKNFGENFEVLCTELALERARLRIWGESLGIVHDPSGRKLPFHPALFRPDIGHDIESSLTQLSNILGKADVITGRYVFQQEIDDKEHPLGLTIFRDSFIKLRERIRKNQKQKSVWQVTRWSVHDEPQLERLVSKIRALLDALSSITNALEGLEQKHTEQAKRQPSTLQAIQNEMLVEEIESISHPESLALLEEIGSAASAPSSLKVVSETASVRLSVVTSSSRSYYTARTQLSTLTDKKNGPAPSSRYAVRQQIYKKQAPNFIKQTDELKSPVNPPEATSKGVQTETNIEDSVHDIPQHQRWIAALTSRNLSREQKLQFTAKDMHYGHALQSVKFHDDQICASNVRLVLQAHDNTPLARRMFHELRNLRLAEIPYVSAAPVGDCLDKILASIEGPPGTPYENGIFWITIRLSEGQPPKLRFQTRVYHPNIDPSGKLCADYATWWQQANQINQNHGGMQWYSRDATNHYSLGSLLVAVCGLLASPNVDDPLVPEIAETFLTDYAAYYKAAALYTMRYAQNGRPAEDELVFPSEKNHPDGATKVPGEYTSKHRSATLNGLRPESMHSTSTEPVSISREEWLSLRDEVDPRIKEVENPRSSSTFTSETISVVRDQVLGLHKPDLWLALLKAVERGDVDVTESLLAGGAYIECQDGSGQTPLSLAARFGHVDVVELLLSKGADIKCQNVSGQTPLSLAVVFGHVDVVELLLDKGAEIKHRDETLGWTPLRWATTCGHRDVFELLFARELTSSTKIALMTKHCNH